jgi:hypothetical protein
MFSSANLKVVYVREDLGKLKSIVIVVDSSRFVKGH